MFGGSKSKKDNVLSRWESLKENGLYLYVESEKEVKVAKNLLDGLGFLNEGSKDAIVEWLRNFSDKRVIIFTRLYSEPKYCASRPEMFLNRDKENHIETSLKELKQIKKYVK